MTQVTISAATPVKNSSQLHDTSLHSAQRKPRLSDRFARNTVFRSLDNLRDGRLTVLSQAGLRAFGDHREGDLQCTITVRDETFFRRVMWGGSLGAAEAYLDGLWDCDDLTNLIRLFARNMETSSDVGGRFTWLKDLAARSYHALQANTKTGSRRNVHEHYDLGNDFFSLFLDETMMYSSAIFERDNMTLAEASTAKLDRICRKLQLEPDDHLLEIGTGWGGLALHVAKNYGCKVTTTTISQEQFEFARQRITEAGLSDRVRLLLEDYRDLKGQYDRLVSIEMIEAVGSKYFDTYFRKCGELLKPTGMMLLQGITIPEQRYGQYLKSCDFIQRYIFPGGCLPSIHAIGDSVARETDMRFLHLEDFAGHYAQTLREWRNRFLNQLDRVREMGFSERFIRMWDYYFCYCEGAFLERATGVVQLLLGKPGCQSDVTVDQVGVAGKGE